MEAEELLRLKRKIEVAKIKVSELTGQKKTLMERLKKEFECESIEEAERKISVLDNEIAELEKQEEEILGHLKSEHPELFE